MEEGGAHGEREEGVVLEEDGDSASEVVELERADVVSPKEDLALVRVVEACRQLKDRALPGTVRADDDLFVSRFVRPQCDRARRRATHAKLSRDELERDILQCPILGIGVLKRHVSAFG